MTMTTKHSVEELIGALEHYPWWSGARMMLLRQGGCDTKDSITHLHTTLRPLAAIELKGVDIERLTHLSTEDLIERFLKRDDYRIVAEEGAAEDLAQRKIDDDGDMVSEEFSFSGEFSTYYDEELGGEGRRRIYSFETLVDPRRQVEAKVCFTIFMADSMSSSE